MAGKFINSGGVIAHISHADVTGSAVVNGRTWRWEFHRYLGPTFLRKDGTPRQCQNPNLEVWAAFGKCYRKHGRAGVRLVTVQPRFNYIDGKWVKAE